MGVVSLGFYLIYMVMSEHTVFQYFNKMYTVCLRVFLDV